MVECRTGRLRLIACFRFVCRASETCVIKTDSESPASNILTRGGPSPIPSSLTMRLSCCLLPIVWTVTSLSTASAFVPSSVACSSSSTTTTRRFLAEQADDKAPIIDQPPMPEGSHEELMYALGVNLARQLGDVRPLVEDGQELASVAKGLLDTVVGRFTEDGQALLLQRRGKELNQLIADRA